MVESAAGDVTSYQGWMWKRHAGFDVVAYEGNSVQGRPIPHSLNAVPEMIWVKNRDGSDNWMVAHKGLDGGNAPFTHYLYLNTDAAEGDYTHWDDTAPTSTHFYVSGYSKNNGSGDKYISMLFSSVAGISSVGSYTGNGATDGSHAITVGFQPRFLIIKRVDASGEAWNVFDTLRGLGAGVNTLSLNINDSNGQTNQGSGKIGLSSTTFIPGSGGEAGWNVNSAKYIYYAHA